MKYELKSCLHRFITGLADQEIKNGRNFFYDGGLLYADDVAEIGLISIMCIAQNLSERLHIGGFGYRFEISTLPNPVFPIHAIPVGQSARFFKVAPFVSRVFDCEVLSCRNDFARVFEIAAKSLTTDVNIQIPFSYAAVVAKEEGPIMGIGR